MAPPRGGRGCWTCKERKIACDRQFPQCRICLGSGRECKGYGMRLSWPRSNDSKRLQVVNARKGSQKSASSSVPHWFINVYNSDIERLHDMLNPLTKRNVLPPLKRSPRWTPIDLAGAEVDLFSYYQNIVSPMLTSINNPAVQSLIFRMTLTDGALASVAIIFGIFALTCIHLNDPFRAQMYQTKARDAIKAAAIQQTGRGDKLRIIVAMNLLVMFEAIVSVDTRVNWAHNICFIKHASIKAYDINQAHTGDSALVLYWAYYFDVISKFSIRHYERRWKAAIACAKMEQLTVVARNSPETTNIIPTLGCSLEVWGAIASSLNTVIHTMDGNDDQTEVLNKLERRLKHAQQVIKVEELYEYDPGSMEKAQQTHSIAELYRLAGLIYLYRVGYSATATHSSLQAAKTSAFVILERLYTCERTFPLFIVGCEARTDNQRATILRLINNTRAQFTPTLITRIHNYLERFWAADELDVAQHTGYDEKISAILSSGCALPAFL
ncbi:hypothetical protein DM02DRAFT_727946 [Periconia macrospinosa]|uniref:Zn(2)-C6 fungal-type domain-containing protein n=1 Tax=Periconia macrospinosa TaxID=97972 RepID=A0A2V1DVM3_9PLEO|nr:hypothetical protein DM02DRAFT_727946 [Periconia macrospinosa]